MLGTRRTSRPLGQQPPLEADWQPALVEERVVKAAQCERRAESLLLVGTQAQQQLAAEEIGQRVGRPVRVPLDLGGSLRSFEAGLLDHEIGRLVDADLTTLEANVEDDPAR